MCRTHGQLGCEGHGPLSLHKDVTTHRWRQGLEALAVQGAYLIPQFSKSRMLVQWFTPLVDIIVKTAQCQGPSLGQVTQSVQGRDSGKYV